MPQGCRGTYYSTTDDLRELRSHCRDALKAAGFRYTPLRLQQDMFRVEGLAGNPTMALLTGMISPLAVLEYFGIFNPIRAVLSARRTKEGIRLLVSIYPRRELSDEPESLMWTQDLAEYVGDNRKATRLFQEVLSQLRARDAVRTIDESVADVSYGAATAERVR